jgi:hypothetical protein
MPNLDCRQTSIIKGLTDLDTVSPFLYTCYTIGILEDLGKTIVIRITICYNNMSL